MLTLRAPSSWPRSAQYALAVGVVLLSLGARWLLNPVLGTSVPFVTVFAALMLLVLSVRPGPFLAGSAVALLGTMVLFVRPRLAPDGHAAIWQLALFGVAAACACLAAWMSQRAEARRRAIEEDLLRRGDELRLITDAMPALIAYVGADLRYQFVNERYREWFGLGPEQLLGVEVSEVLGDAAFERLRPHAEAALAGRRTQFENRLLLAHGCRHVLVEFVPDVRANGAVAGFYSLTSDISEQKRAEAAQARLAAVVEASSDAIISISPDGEILTWNPGAERLFGYCSREAIGRSIDLIVPPRAADEERSILERVRRGEPVEAYDTVRRRKDGREIDVSAAVSPIRDASGRLIGVSRLDRDITERKQAERTLRESERRLATLVGNLPGMAYRCDYEYTWSVEFISERVRDIIGYDADEFIAGRVSWPQVTHAEDLERLRDATDTSVRERRPFELEYRVVHADGSERWVWDRGEPIVNSNDDLVAFEGFVADITHRKRAELALEDADRRKDEFLATLAHELRNPLAAIRSAAELLGARTRPEQLDRATVVIKRQVASMVHLIDDLLDVSRITHGTIELRRERLSLLALVNQAIDAAQPWIQAKRHLVETEAPADALEVEADAVRLVQVFTNILNNACKYTDPGGRIDVRVAREGDDAVVEIRDTGIGIPGDKLDVIFEMFSRLEAPGRGDGGLGIGLALSRRLVALHGGSMRASSEGPGQGSRFSVRLPALPAAHEHAPLLSTPKLRLGRATQRILIVDDNVDAADTLALLLAAQGHVTRTVYDGRSALAELATFPPDVVLLDLGLPDIDGTEVCRTLRAQPWGAGIFVIALSGWGQERDKRRTAEAGFDMHMTKPANLEQLQALLASGASKRGRQTLSN